VPNDKFLWHSNGSKDTAKLLAKELGLTEKQCGTTPPAGFSGTIVCWGAAPGEKFKWEDRKIRAIFNDPRTVRKYSDRRALLQKLQSAKISAALCYEIAKGNSKYGDVCAGLKTPEGAGFLTAKAAGINPKAVFNQETLNAALEAGHTHAFEAIFNSEARVRAFVVNGKIISAVIKGGGLDQDVFVSRASMDVAMSEKGITEEQATAVLTALLKGNIVSPAKDYWKPHVIVSGPKRQTVIAAAQALNFDFCAVDLEASDESHKVLNVITAPGMTDVPTVVPPLVNTISIWVENNSRTAKDLLLTLVNDASDEEADSLLEELCKFKAEFSGGSEDPATDKQSAGGADSTSA